MNQGAISLDQQISEVKRELNMRMAVYPNLIRKGSLDQITAYRQTECMQAVLMTLLRVQKDKG